MTFFEIPDYERDELVHHLKFVIRPVLKCGIAVPLDYTYCKLFHVASTKTSVTLVTDTCTGMLDTGKTDSQEKKQNGVEKGTVAEDGNKSAKSANGSGKSNSACDNCDGTGVEEKIESKENIEAMTEKLRLSDE